MTEEEGGYWNAFSNDLVFSGATVAECLTTDDAQFVVYVLSRRGIRSGILVPGHQMDLRLIQVRVAPDDEESARKILAEPLAPELSDADDSEQVIETPPPPNCPQCNSDQIVLDGIERANQWRCEQCGNAWAEYVEER